MRTTALLALLALGLTTRADDGKLTAILGDVPDKWRISWRNGGKNDYTLSDLAGQPLLNAGPNSTILTRLPPITGDAEVTIRFRLDQTPKREIWFWLAAGLPKVDDAGETLLKLGLRIFPGVDKDTLHWGMAALPGQKYGAAGTYDVRSLPADRKGWPDFVKARAEADFNSTAPLGKRWLTVRYVLRKNLCLVYLDGRLLREARHPDLVTTGHLKFTLFEGVQLGSVRVKPLPPAEPLFETVELDDYLNAARFQGSALDRKSLPAVPQLGGVPFLLPKPDTDGNDHIDLKPSYLRVGLLEGGFDGWHGPLSRWGGALHCDKGRICFRVRNGQYRALHLLAAAADEPDTVPLVTAQFYRPAAGFPLNFAARVPLFTSTAKGEAIPVKLADGKQGHLFLVTIPLEPEGLDAFADLEYLEVELTKQVQVHRSYPDPIYYSQHGAGLPSSVHVFGMTLERPLIDVELQPEFHAHIWTQPPAGHPHYRVTLRSRATTDTPVELVLTAFEAQGTLSVRKAIVVPAAGAKSDSINFHSFSSGHIRIQLEVRDAQGKRTRTRSMAWLQPDTRERGGWEEGKGPLFGFWDWAGGHHTPGGMDRLRVMVAAGAESTNHSFHAPGHAGDLFSAEEKAFAEKHGMQSHFLAYQLAMGKHSLGVDWDPKQPAAMEKALIATMKKSPLATRSKLNRPELAVFFAEPVLGPISYMSLPEYYGEPAYKMTAEEEKNYRNYRDQFVTAARAIKREWPEAKCLFPWGLPLFPVPFLRHSKEARDLMDGPALDVVLFERLPEMQLHQVTLSSQLWQLKQEWLKAGKKWPHLTSLEGPCVGPAAPGSLTPQQEADHTVRALLILAAYGTTRHLGWPTPFECASSWGESHYGSGMLQRQPLLSPKPVYSAYATLTRQLNRMNFVKVVPTGSHTVLCLQFKHYKSNELLHVFWTLRGKRPVTVNATARLTVWDWMDNSATPERHNEQATFTVTSSPCYARGLPDGVKITLGEPDHSDAVPGPHAQKLADLGDGSWKLSAERDEDYENSHPEFVRRFPGKMSIKIVDQTLAVHLDKQDRERRTMPFYTTLLPAQPLVVSGKASHLGLWVKAASDWGRVVYCLRDARGERWLSVGKKGEWNVDDVHCWSAFCFDGRRYLRFELPANAPYDGYREAGTSFWGPYGKGDGIVDLPLTLEKIIVERRTHVIAPTEQLPATGDDVLLGSLVAEYASPEDRSAAAVRRSQLRMPAR